MKKIPVKTLYLLLVIGIGLVGLGIGSTYAIFTASAEISDPITLNSSLEHTSDIIETIEVEVPAGETISTTLNVTNSSGTTLNYAIWYLDEDYDIQLGTESGTPSGSVTSGSNKSISIKIKNYENENVTVILGISSNSGSVVLGSGMVAVPSKWVSYNLIDYVTNLYVSGNPTEITHSKEDGTSDTYYYSYQDDSKTWGLMNDGLKIDTSLDATTTGLATTVTEPTAITSGTEGNIRYFGPSDKVNNYIYFNCSDYSNQTDSTCEKWRIIGIVDGKVKIIRNESIGELAWDQDKNQDSSLTTYSNNWETSSLQLMLNNSYYYGDTSGTITYYGSMEGETFTNLNMGTIGLKNNTTRQMISESIWYLGGYSIPEGLYPNEIYTYERTNIVGMTIYEGNPFSVATKIGLMYASDYVYGTDLRKCNEDLYNYDSSANEYACRNNNWLFESNLFLDEWLITPFSTDDYQVFAVIDGAISGYFGGVVNEPPVRPVIYLDPELSIEPEGYGTSTNPYRIKVS